MKLLQVEQKGGAVRNCFEPVNVCPKETLVQYVCLRGWSRRQKPQDHRRFGVLRIKRFLSLKKRGLEKKNIKAPSYLSGCSETLPRKLLSLYNFSLKYPCKVVDRNLYTLMCQENMVYLAYIKLKSKKECMSPGLSPETLGRLTQEWVENLLHQLRCGIFEFQPACRAFISKFSRVHWSFPIATLRDKIVQEMIRIVLEVIYEPLFINESFGFRPGKNPHSALLHIDSRFKSSTWCIQGSTKRCFDSTRYSVILSVLEKKISDQRFLGFVKKSLQVGYGNFGHSNQACLIGIPEGSVLSPVLCNIYLHEFDCFILKQKQSFNSIKQKNGSTKWSLFSALVHRVRVQDDKVLVRSPVKQVSKYGSIKSLKGFFSGLEYCRYAGDWVIGIQGSYKEVAKIKLVCNAFLSEHLLLLPGELKTAVLNVNRHKISFLGCVFFRSFIPVGGDKLFKNTEKRASTREASRAISGLRFEIPINDVRKKLIELGFLRKKKAFPKTIWTPMEKDQIVSLYNLVFNGFATYYTFGSNYGKFMRFLNWVLKLSCARTLAVKYQTSVVKIIKQYGARFGAKDGDVSFVKARFLHYRGLQRFLVSKKNSLNLIHALNNCCIEQR